MVKYSNKTLVVIPYLASGAQGNELELAVAGWRQHFKEDYHIVIVGDRPEFMHLEGIQDGYHYLTTYDPVYGGDITFIPCPRVEPIEGQYLPHIDMVHKFRKVYEVFPKSKGFIYTCDDIYPVRNFDSWRVREIRVESIVHYSDWTKEKDWMRDLMKTAYLCKSEGYEPLNFVCHLPVYYEWKHLLKIYDTYDCDHVSYIVENIYFNKVTKGKISDTCWLELQIADRDRYQIKTSNPGINTAEQAHAVWITNTNSGWSKKLEEILAKHYELVIG